MPPSTIPRLALYTVWLPPLAAAQALGGSTLPPLAPTAAQNGPAARASGSVAPLAATATPADRPGTRHHRADVRYNNGLLSVHAENSSLNGILRAISERTGMRITGGVADQRVFGDYGPAAPGTVIGTLLDGTGTNVVLLGTATDRPAELILTPRTGGPTPPSPALVADDDEEAPNSPENAGSRAPAPNTATVAPATTASSAPRVPASGGASGLASIPQPINNVNGSPSNVSPNAGNYPTANSVPLNSLPTPSTTPNTSGIVSAPNPPPAGSDTAALLNGRTTNLPGNVTITDQPTAPVGQNGNAGNASATGSSGTDPAAATSTGSGGSAAAGTLTPQQVFEKLQELRAQRQKAVEQTTTAPQ